MKNGIIFSPVDGEVIELENVCDEVFSSGIMGDGFAVLPSSKNFYSPVSGKVESIHAASHAYAITTNEGIDVLVHIGVDTVELDGDCFERKISVGEQVKKGDIIAYADIDKIMEKGFDPVCIVVVSNSDKMHNIKINYGKCYSGDEIMTYEQK